MALGRARSRWKGRAIFERETLVPRVLAYVFHPNDETHVMPKSDPSLMDSLLLLARPTTPSNKPKIGINPDLEVAFEECWDPAEWAINRADSDRQPSEADAKSRDRSMHAQALVSPSFNEYATPGELASDDATFTEDDPRACPRDLEEFKLAVALELDRLRDNKKIYY